MKTRKFTLVVAVLCGLFCAGPAAAGSVERWGLICVIGEGVIEFRPGAETFDASKHPCRAPGQAPLKLMLTSDTRMNGFSVGALHRRYFKIAYSEGASTVEKILVTESADLRANFEATGYVGLAIDSFAANDLTNYLNPDDSGDIKERAIAGFNFDYRVAGDPKEPLQLWVYGETLHGVRSADVDCSKTPNVSNCSGFNPASPTAPTLYLLRNASSLEALAGVRFEFWRIGDTSASPASLYLKTQAGFFTVSGDADDVTDSYHAGIGALATRGPLAGSYLEIGYGTNDVFVRNSNDRYKFDGFITWKAGPLSRLGIYPFAQMHVDADLADGSDSVQTFLGFDFDLGNLFGAGFK